MAISPEFRTSWKMPSTNGRNGLGTALVMAGGNGKFNIEGENFGDDSNFHNLSNSRYVIAVGAHNADGQSAFFSSPGTNLLISAPGVGLVTTGGNSVGSQSSTYVSGTSFAAPLVSSAIALMLEVNPDLGYRDIQKILAITAKSSGAPGATSNGALNFNGSGLVFDREMGFGTLDAAAAVKLAQQWTEHSTASNEEHLGGSFSLPTEFGPTSQSIDVTIDNPGDQGFSVGFVELTLEISDTDLRNLSIELVSPNGNEGAYCPQPLRARQSDLSEFHLLLGRDLGRGSVRHLDGQPDPRFPLRQFLRARCQNRHLRRCQGNRRHLLLHLGLSAAGGRRSEPLDDRRSQWRHRHAELRRGFRRRRHRSGRLARTHWRVRRSRSTTASRTQSAPATTTGCRARSPTIC